MTANAKPETDLCTAVVDKREAVDVKFKNLLQKVFKPKARLQRGTSQSFVSDCGCARVIVQAERLSKKYPSHQTLLFGKGKDAFAFHDRNEDDGFIFGSKEGEYCLLRIRIENSPNEKSVTVENIIDVQMVYPTGGTVNLKTAEAQNNERYKEVVALLEPGELRKRVTSGSPTDIEKSCHRSKRFQLHIQVALECGKHVDIVKTICWRTIPSHKPVLLLGGHGPQQKTWKRLPHVFGAGLLFHSSKADGTKHDTRNLPPASKEAQQQPSSSEVSWRACF